MTSATPGVTDMEMKGGVLHSITLTSPVVVGYTPCGLSWFRHEVTVGVNVPLTYGVDSDGPDRTYQICCDVATVAGADLRDEARHFSYPSWVVRPDGTEQERVTFEWAGRPDHDWAAALAVDGAQLIDTSLRFDRDGYVIGQMLELETGQIVTLEAQHPADVVEESFKQWSQLCLTK